MGTISKEAFQRLYLLTLTASMRKGIFGRFRMQKLTYLAEKEAGRRPFRFRRDQAGPFSKDIANRRRELVESGFLIEKEMPDREEGWNYYLGQYLDSTKIKRLMGQVDAEALRQITESVEEHGYKSTKELRETIYAIIPKLRSVIFNKTVLTDQIEDEIELEGFDEEDIEDLQLLLTPGLVSNMRRLAELDRSTELDLSGIAELGTSI